MSVTDAGGGQFELLLAVDIGIDDFASNWAYCDRLSSYVARMVSHNRTDSLLYSNLFSSALNELLETAFRAHGSGGSLVCSVLRRGPTDRIELTVPCDDESAGFYAATMARMNRPDVEDQYRDSLYADGPLDPGVGLLELAVDYQAAMTLQPASDKSVRLVADLTLEDRQS
jgi:hypothetical protein